MAAAAGSVVQDAGKPSPVATLDSLAMSEIPAEHQAELPRPSAQLNDLNRLHQVADLAAPATGLPGGGQS